MATTQSRLKTISDGPANTTNAADGGAELATIVAQTTQFSDLPDFDVFRAVCDCIADSIDAAATEQI